jgi:hypothetical protein
MGLFEAVVTPNMKGKRNMAVELSESGQRDGKKLATPAGTPGTWLFYF